MSVTGAAIRTKILKKNAVPSQFLWTSTSPYAAARTQRLARRTATKTMPSSYSSNDPADNDDECIVDTMESDAVGGFVEVADVEDCDNDHRVDVGIQTDVQLMDTQCTGTQTCEQFSVFSLVKFKYDNDGMQYYTGLDSYVVFMAVLASLGPAAYKLQYLYGRKPQLDIADQLFLTLVKLRTYKPNFELSRLFCITETDVYVTFVTWIRFMSLQWREINLWPDRVTIDTFAPLDMKQNFPTTRVIVDGTEMPVKKPKLPGAQQVSFSTYKNRNTAKALIGVSPGGLVSFVSDAYGGSTTDRQIVERCGLTQLVEPGDSIMADKGFDVQDIFAPYDVTVNMPTFFRKRNRISNKTLNRDRKISSKHVHVERVIGLGKTYKILATPMNQTEAALSSDIVFVCYMLVNFRPCIVPTHA